ncbi:MAG: hypothetical protein JWM32_2199 [Verrucomicrobia bacterium]|nr:hypothetical protein [Verrucomicrobiota bacterium]
MISHTHRCIFVHIPKTAGNSVNRIFGVGWEDHKDLARYAEELPPEKFARYFKFAIVRNPWDRLFSDYNYQRKKSRAGKLFVRTDSGRLRTFSEWVRVVLADPYRYQPAAWAGNVSPRLHRWSPQVDWISIDGQNRMDFVLRIENLQADFGAVCRQLGMPVTRLPRRNRRLHGHYSWYYDEETRDLVGSHYARDIAAFGYRFERSALCEGWCRMRSTASTVMSSLRTSTALTAVRFKQP